MCREVSTSPVSILDFRSSRGRRLFSALGAALLLAAPVSLSPVVALGQAQAAVASVGSVQLTVTVDQSVAYLNGQTVNFQAAPRNIGGRVMLPLRETAALMGQMLGGSGSTVQLGRLTVDTVRNTASLGGVLQDAGNVASPGTTTYVSARLLADALSGNFSADPTGRTVTVTALRGTVQKVTNVSP